MESTRPIRALTRGLDALTVLNARAGATVSEVAQEIRLPRTTVYRILETLCNSGFVFRDAADDRYRLTLMVRGLSEGFDDESWIEQIAKPTLTELCRDVVWPVSLATLSGNSMLLRATTDHETPLAIERYSAGCRVPLLTSAAGRVYLACCAGPEREMLIERSADPAQRPELELKLAEIAAQGFATATRVRRLVDEATVGVPVMANGRVIAALTLRFMTSNQPQAAGISRFLPKLRQCAAKIGAAITEKRAGAQPNGAPVAAV